MIDLNPIIAAASQAAANTDHAISGMTVVAPIVSGNALLVVNWAYGAEADKRVSDDLPEGVSLALDWERTPPTIIALPPMTDTGSLAIAAAWWSGAWDVNRTSVSSSYKGALPPYMAYIDDAVRLQGYVSWYWRPMLRGPEIRVKAHGHKDTTLNKWTLGRDGAPPYHLVPPIKPDQQVSIRLGKGPQAADKPNRNQRMATSKQRGYLGRLLREAGMDDALPDDLTLRQASNWIERLGPGRAAERKATANQVRMINHLAAQLGERGVTGWGLNYYDAQKRIDELRDKL